MKPSFTEYLINEAYYSKSGGYSDYIKVDLWDDNPDRGDHAEAELEVQYDTTPPDRGVGYEGGVTITGLNIAKPFTFIGQQFEAGQPFPKELIKYTDFENENDLEQYLTDKVDIPD